MHCQICVGYLVCAVAFAVKVGFPSHPLFHHIITNWCQISGVGCVQYIIICKKCRQLERLAHIGVISVASSSSILSPLSWAQAKMSEA